MRRIEDAAPPQALSLPNGRAAQNPMMRPAQQDGIGAVMARHFDAAPAGT
jgi:hypothetical protein